jgi:hypothetical protein
MQFSAVAVFREFSFYHLLVAAKGGEFQFPGFFENSTQSYNSDFCALHALKKTLISSP